MPNPAKRADLLHRRVLVTGGTGFVGRRLVSALSHLGCQVFVLTRRAETVADVPVRCLLGSIEDAASLGEAVRMALPDVVFHLAAESLVTNAMEDPVGCFDTNTRGTWLLLDACRLTAPGALIVLASSAAVYGTPLVAACSEDHPLGGRHPYGASKICSEIVAQSFAQTYGMAIGIARLANLYGQGDLNFSRLIPGTIRAALKGVSPVIRSDGSPLRDFLHVDDAVAGMLALAEWLRNHKGAAAAFNFGSGDPVSVLDLTRRILAFAGRADIQPDVRGEATAESRAMLVSIEAAARTLHWQPAGALDQRLGETIAWYRRHPDAMDATASRGG